MQDESAAGTTASVPGRRRSITTGDGVRLSLIEAGSGGRPLVIIPGWTQTAAEFEHQLGDLSRDHRVIAIDMRGHGESERPDHGYRVSRLAADLRDVLQALDLRGATALGHSMGCSVIWNYLDLYGPGRLASIVLVDQAASQVIQPGWSAEEQRDYGCTQTLDQLYDFCRQLAGPEGERFTRDMFATGPGLFTPSFPRAELDWVVREILKMPRRHAAALMFNHAMQDWRDVIRRIRLPSLVVGGCVSIFPPASQAWISRQVPSSRVVIFEPEEGGGHFMFLENPTKFNAVVREFLAA